jgi:hypothetical protein
MHGPELIWRFGRWIASRESGAAHLTWTDGELVLRVRGGNAISVQGPDPASVGGIVGCEPVGHDDLLVEAAEVATQRGIPETEALGAVKEVLQRELKSWLLDEDRSMELSEGEPDEGDGPTISISHAIVELLLSDTESAVELRVLPLLDVLLRRTPDFLELYSPLRLSEEADLVVAKITGQRTAEEIASRSPHGTDEVVRLLAALVATGMLEPVPIETAFDQPGVLTVDLPEEEPTRRQLPVSWIAAAAAVLAVALVILAVVLLRPDEPASPIETDSSWGLAVDMGCEPQELQRVLNKARQHPRDLRPVKVDTGDGDPCWRLVWGRFSSREEAEAETANVPEQLLLGGFEPHPVELPEDAPEGVSE